MMLIGCEVTYNNQYYKLKNETENLGFSYDEINSLIEKPNATTKLAFINKEIYNSKLTNDDIFDLIKLGLNKRIIIHLTPRELLFFKDKKVVQIGSSATLYKVMKIGSEWAFYPEDIYTYKQELAKKEKIDGDSNICLYNQVVCESIETSKNSKNNNIGWISLRTSVSKFSQERYVVINSFQWLSKPKYYYGDYFGLKISDNMTIDYSSIFGKYENLESNNKQNIVWFDKSYINSPNGYYIKINKNNSNNINSEFGYLYSEVYLNSRDSIYFDTETSYLYSLEDISDQKIFEKISKGNIHSFKDKIVPASESKIRILVKEK